jgi:hypothetical protein
MVSAAGLGLHAEIPQIRGTFPSSGWDRGPSVLIIDKMSMRSQLQLRVQAVTHYPLTAYCKRCTY